MVDIGDQPDKLTSTSSISFCDHIDHYYHNGKKAKQNKTNKRAVGSRDTRKIIAMAVICRFSSHKIVFDVHFFFFLRN